MLKKCLQCGAGKDVSEFWKRSRNKDGLHTWCIQCCSAYSKDIRYKPQNLERDRERSKAWYEKHKKRQKAYFQKYYEQHRERISDQAKQWRKEHLERDAANKLKWYKENKDTDEFKRQAAEHSAAWNQRNRWSIRLACSKAVWWAVRCGALTKKPCEVCGTEERIQAHHHKGYELAHWFDVQWLCFRHHKEAHGKRHWEQPRR